MPRYGSKTTDIHPANFGPEVCSKLVFDAVFSVGDDGAIPKRLPNDASTSIVCCITVNKLFTSSEPFSCDRFSVSVKSSLQVR